MARRSFGMVRRLGSGRWQASYRHPDLGKRINGPSTWKAKADATAWLAVEEAKLRTGVTAVDPQRGRIKFESFADDWMRTRPLRDRTREIYASQLRVHILPEFGSISLQAITPERVRRWHADLVRSAPTMAPKAYRQLRTMLGTAVEDGLLAENPCRIKGAANEHAAERKIPTVAQIEQILEAIDPRYRVAVLLASYCGLRKSECLGLARRHVVLDGPHPVILVERQRNEVGR